MNDIILEELNYDAKHDTIFYMMGSVGNGENTRHRLATEDGPDVAAKKVVYLETGNERYYIKHYRGQLYNPEDINHRRRRINDWKYLKVGSNTFKFYTKFLLTRSKVHLHHAERSM